MLFATFLLLAAASALFFRLLLDCLAFRRLELAMPGPASLPLLGNALQLVPGPGEGMGGVTRRLLRLWGGRTALFRASLLGHLFVVLSDPDDVEALLRKKETQGKSRLFYRWFEYFSRDGLITLNGSKWRAHRRALQPAFHAEVLQRHMDVFTEECDAFLRRLRPGGAAQSVGQNLKRCAGGIFVRASLVSRMGEAEARGVADILSFMDVFARSVNTRLFTPWLWPDALYGLTEGARRLRRLKADVDGFAERVIRTRREKLQREVQQGRGEDFIRQRATLIDVLVGAQQLPDAEILDELKTFLGAAIDTTVVTLGWALKVLSVRPDVQRRVRQEVKSVVGSDDKIVTHHLPRLQYTECVLKETMRLLPTVPLLARSNPVRTEFRGYTVPADTTFVVNIYGAHRDPRYWPDPLTFDPDRFSAERSAGRHPYAFLPFSAGPRSCIGERYAMMVMKTFLAALLPRYRVEPAEDGHTDPAAFPYIFNVMSRMPGGVKVKFTAIDVNVLGEDAVVGDAVGKQAASEQVVEQAPVG